MRGQVLVLVPFTQAGLYLTSSPLCCSHTGHTGSGPTLGRPVEALSLLLERKSLSSRRELWPGLSHH